MKSLQHKAARPSSTHSKPQAAQKPSSNSQAKESGPQDSQEDNPQPLTSLDKLAKAQADATYWGQLAVDPQLSPTAAAWALNQARSARAEAALRQKALQSQADGESPSDPTLAQITSPPPLSLPQNQPLGQQGPMTTSPPISEPGT